ncbi:MAG: hypothetical protein D6797_01940 [Bdellovibrio sp.]|nr:MAG: hypothetical protein D6797_01940 [Bdellovibrio sp.]
MATTVIPIRNLPPLPDFNEKDVLVIFGEVFEKGYVNGLIEAARKRGMKVIYATVGRREKDGQLRPLTEEELQAKNQDPLINVPLEAGFDLEKAETQPLSPVDQLKDLKMSQWKEARLDWDLVEESRVKGVKRFREAVKDYLVKLKPLLAGARRVVIAHTMAGGFPRAKIVMPVANRVFKGTGPRYQSSKEFWDSELGRLCDKSFMEVTAETFEHLIELTQDYLSLPISYVAYGYHGTEVLIEDKYEWQSYSPYLQGFAKLRLENIAENYWKKGVSATVFNAPEILTNSSSIFLGLEVVLYPLMDAFRKEGRDVVKPLLKEYESYLKEPFSLKDITQKTQSYLTNELIRNWPSLKGWPQHNGPEQMHLMRTSSQELIDMHKDPKRLITLPLSEWVFKACGEIMLSKAWEPTDPVLWMGHDIVAKQVVSFLEK